MFSLTFGFFLLTKLNLTLQVGSSLLLSIVSLDDCLSSVGGSLYR